MFLWFEADAVVELDALVFRVLDHWDSEDLPLLVRLGSFVKSKRHQRRLFLINFQAVCLHLVVHYFDNVEHFRVAAGSRHNVISIHSAVVASLYYLKVAPQ